MFKVVNCGRYIPLTQGQKTLVDVGDFDALTKYKWHAALMHGYVYAKRCESIGKLNGKWKTKCTSMARQIMGHPSGMFVDHKNGDTLDNRRCNLRVATRQQNTCNRKASTIDASFGVSQAPRKKTALWRSRIMKDGKSIHVGYFENKEDAARARDRKARELHGEFAALNFPEAQ